jgi:hypothetical protein
VATEAVALLLLRPMTSANSDGRGVVLQRNQARISLTEAAEPLDSYIQTQQHEGL